MDLNTRKPKEETVTVYLKDPLTDEPFLKDDGFEMSIVVYHPYSKTFKDVAHESADLFLSSGKISKSGVNITSKEAEDVSLTQLAKVTKSWDIQLNGECPELTEESAKSFYEDFPWIKAQVEVRINDLKEILGNS